MRKLFTLISLLFCATLVFAQKDTVSLQFQPAGGIHSGPVEVTLTAPVSGATIYYTTDGTRPSSGARKYSKPIVVKNPTSIRARYYVNGKASDVYTASYLNEREYSLPVVAISMNPTHLWDSLQGIHAMGCCADSIMPYQGANFWKGWERTCNVELYELDGSQGINQECGIRIFGGWSKGLPQKSFAMIARGKYGDKRFDYKLFPEQNPDIKEYKSFVLRNNGGDFRNGQIRDAFTTQLAKSTGLTVQAYRPAIVYLNGKYWGIMSIREKINEHFLEAHFDVDKDSLDLLKHRHDSQHGKSKSYRSLISWMQGQDFSEAEAAKDLQAQIDLQDFLNYNITETYSDNRDAGGNIRYWKPHGEGEKWKWILFDMDAGLGNSDWTAYKRNTLDKFTRLNNEVWPDPPWSTFLIRKVLESDSMRYAYINTWCDLLGTCYNPDRAVKLLDSLTEQVRAEMPYHMARWGGSMNTWERHLKVIREYVTKRPEFIYQHIAQKFELREPVDVVVRVEGRGTVRFNSVSTDKEIRGRYFREIPMNLEAEPQFGYHFAGWSVPDYEGGELRIGGDIDIVARFEPNEPSNSPVVLNEVCIAQNEKFKGDWIELYNTSSEDYNIKGWRIDDNRMDWSSHLVKEDIIVPANGYVILAHSPENVMKAYPKIDSTRVYEFKLKLSHGDRFYLYDSTASCVDSLYFTDDVIPEDDEGWAIMSRVNPEMDEWIAEEASVQEENPAFIAWKAEQQRLLEEAESDLMYYAMTGGLVLSLGVGLAWFRKSRKSAKEKTPVEPRIASSEQESTPEVEVEEEHQ